MLVSLERSGGYTGQRVTASVETDELPAGQMAEALRALEALASTPPAMPPAGTNQPCYRLTMHRTHGPQVVVVIESQVPAALRPLLAELERRARSQS
jgi:hypothetical protein